MISLVAILLGMLSLFNNSIALLLNRISDRWNTSKYFAENDQRSEND